MTAQQPAGVGKVLKLGRWVLCTSIGDDGCFSFLRFSFVFRLSYPPSSPFSSARLYYRKLTHGENPGKNTRAKCPKRDRSRHPGRKEKNMQKYSVERCVGNTVEVVGVYETKEEMLKALEAEKKKEKPGVVTGISGRLDEKGRRRSGEVYRVY